jgi:hypothetical protein
MDAVQRAIREAKNAGWKPIERSVFLDPQFWRALGRGANRTRAARGSF